MTDRQISDPGIATYRHDVPPGAAASSAAARLEGRLALVDNCLVVAGGTAPVQPVFPEGSVRWDEASRSLVYRGTAYRIGSTIVLGGGGVGNEADYAARPGVSIRRCEGARLFVVGS